MAEKDSYWFKHDSTAGRGLRMRKMAHIYGHWGKGIYWDVIEILRDQANYCFDSDDSSLQMLCDLIGCKDDSKFLSWFKDCVKFELFIIDNGKFLSEVLCRNMANWESKKGNGSKGGRPHKTETETEFKPKRKRNNNLNETIREEKRREEDNNVFFDENLKLYYAIAGDEKIYGNLHQRLLGGLSEKAIEEHCINNGINYEK